jgi:hypothetical protein
MSIDTNAALDAAETTETDDRQWNAPNTAEIEAAVKAEMDGLHTRFRHLSYVNRDGEVIEKLHQKLTFYVSSLERDADFANNGPFGLINARRTFKAAERNEQRQSSQPDADTIDGRAFMDAEIKLAKAEAEYNEAEDASEFGLAYFHDLLGYEWSATPRTNKERDVEFITKELYAAREGIDPKTVERQARRQAAAKK